MKTIPIILILSALCFAQTEGNPANLGLGLNSFGYSGYKLREDSTRLRLFRRTVGAAPNSIIDETLIFRATGGRIYLFRTVTDTTFKYIVEVDSVKRNGSE